MFKKLLEFLSDKIKKLWVEMCNSVLIIICFRVEYELEVLDSVDLLV